MKMQNSNKYISRVALKGIALYSTINMKLSLNRNHLHAMKYGIILYINN